MSHPLACPFCHSAEITIKAPVQKSYAAIGCIVGATGGFNAALKRLHVGRALTAHVGPTSLAFNGVAGAVIAAMTAAAIGCELGAKSGAKIDLVLFDNYRCCACGKTFKV